jgi:YidC/Oxa1 family membrane protein insertase
VVPLIHLRKVDPKLDQLIDWGRWFGFLAKPLFYALTWTHDTLAHNFGWSIVLVTVAINMLTLPLRLTSMKSAKKMQALQPQIQAINARYKNLSLRDPKQQEKNAKRSERRAAGGVSPLEEEIALLDGPVIYEVDEAILPWDGSPKVAEGENN